MQEERGGSVGPRAVRPPMELELRGRNERTACEETKSTVPILKTLDQLFTVKVRSTSIIHIVFRI